MPIKIENNRHFVGSETVTTTGVPGPEGLGVLARVFIDLGIAVATVGAALLTGGTSLIAEGSVLAGTVIETVLPATVEGLIGATTGLVTNTTIDIEEGNTDVLTLGLDIGLPFATEFLGEAVNAAIKRVPLSQSVIFKTAEKFNLGLNGKGEFKNLNDLIKYNRSEYKTLGSSTTQLFGENGPIDSAAFYKEASESLEKQVNLLDQSFRSLTDVFNKLSGEAREIIARLLPRLTKIIKQLKYVLKQAKKIVSNIMNPVNLALTKAKTATKAILKNIKADGNDVKLRLNTIRQRYNIRKQSILQNALISKYNITRVESTWVLGTSLVVNNTEDDGTIINAHLIWWFIPEMTKHDGSRGAVPEPMGKRPVGMLNINQAQYDAIMAEASKGRFYLDNVANGKSSSSLFGGPSGINVSDLKSNFISRLFKNAISIIPGYSLFVDVKSSIKQFQTLTDKIVRGELGTDYVKQLTNYKSHLHKFGSMLLPKQFNEAANAIYSSGTYDGSGILKSVDSRAQAIQSNLNKSGTVMHVKNY